MAADRFHYFPKLSMELRNMIWEQASFEPRVVEISIERQVTRRSRTDPFKSSYIMSFKTNSAVPAILHVSQEARAEGLRHYELCFNAHTKYVRLDNDVNPNIYMNFAVDTPYFFSVSCGLTYSTMFYILERRKFLYPWADKIEQLAINADVHGFEHDFPADFEPLAFPALKNVILTHEPSAAGLRCAVGKSIDLYLIPKNRLSLCRHAKQAMDDWIDYLRDAAPETCVISYARVYSEDGFSKEEDCPRSSFP